MQLAAGTNIVQASRLPGFLPCTDGCSWNLPYSPKINVWVAHWQSSDVADSNKACNAAKQASCTAASPGPRNFFNDATSETKIGCKEAGAMSPVDA